MTATRAPSQAVVGVPTRGRPVSALPRHATPPPPPPPTRFQSDGTGRSSDTLRDRVAAVPMLCGCGRDRRKAPVSYAGVQTCDRDRARPRVLAHVPQPVVPEKFGSRLQQLSALPPTALCSRQAQGPGVSMACPGHTAPRRQSRPPEQKVLKPSANRSTYRGRGRTCTELLQSGPLLEAAALAVTLPVRIPYSMPLFC